MKARPQEGACASPCGRGCGLAHPSLIRARVGVPAVRDVNVAVLVVAATRRPVLVLGVDDRGPAAEVTAAVAGRVRGAGVAAVARSVAPVIVTAVAAVVTAAAIAGPTVRTAVAAVVATLGLAGRGHGQHQAGCHDSQYRQGKQPAHLVFLSRKWIEPVVRSDASPGRSVSPRP